MWTSMIVTLSVTMHYFGKAALLAAVWGFAFIMLLMMIACVLHCAKAPNTPEHEIVFIEDSPMPAKSPNTPSTNRSALRVMRAGRARVSAHRRKYAVYNPVAKNDCAFMCVMRSAKKRIGEQKITHLRAQVAENFKQAYVDDMTVATLNVREVVANTEHNLGSYLTALRWDLWASSVEAALAAEICGVTIVVKVSMTRASELEMGNQLTLSSSYGPEESTLHPTSRCEEI